MADELERIRKKHRNTLTKIKKIQQGSRDPEMLNIIRQIIEKEDKDANQGWEINNGITIDKSARPKTEEDSSQRS